MQLVKKKRGRPKMAAKDKKVPVTIMVKATMAKRLRQTFKKMADEPTFTVKGIVKINDHKFDQNAFYDWFNSDFDMSEFVNFYLDKLKSNK